MGVRSWTHGYDLYAPIRSVLFHEYAVFSKRRGKVRQYTEQGTRESGKRKAAALRRLTSLIGIDPSVDPSTFSHREEARYGLGTAREASLFYRLFRIDVNRHTAAPLCGWVRSGQMHRQFTRYLRPDGNGIDYSNLVTFNTSLYTQPTCSRREFC